MRVVIAVESPQPMSKLSCHCGWKSLLRGTRQHIAGPDSALALDPVNYVTVGGGAAYLRLLQPSPPPPASPESD